MIRPKTLQQHLSLFMLLPVAGLLLAMGFAVFLFVRAHLLTQWREAAILKLERAAHDVDSRLTDAKDWMRMYHNTAGEQGAESIREWVVKQLKDLEGVERVTITMLGTEADEISPEDQCYMWTRRNGNPDMNRWMGRMDFKSAEIAGITLPRYDDLIEHETVSLTSDLLDKNGQAIGVMEVVIRFRYLIEGIVSAGWSQNENAFLASDAGHVLACNILDGTGERVCRDDVVLAAAKAMQGEQFGTIIQPEYSKDTVIGFYRLNQAPWSLVLVARSEEVLAPIFHFRTIYFVVLAGFFLFILLLIRLVSGRTVALVQDVSRAAKRVAQGHFDALPPAQRQDEVGQLIQSFNEMVLQLDERLKLKEAMDLAMRVQQNLLPGNSLQIGGLRIAGESIYCNETGGDYYDFLYFPDWSADRVGIAVGDVAGHGVSAALFMATARAFLRSRITQPGNLSDVVRDVNRLLCTDTSRTGDFMSLFIALVDTRLNTIQWVRAGHSPAIVYDPVDDSFEELNGKGIVLGLDESTKFIEYEYTGWNDGKILCIGTDGIWETENPLSETYGMERLRNIIREYSHASPNEIIRAVTESLAVFRDTRPQEDDVTLVVLKGRRES
jgi:phosphoserine phosphatase RsbU/P